jgi:hypothetical protein
VNPDVKGIVSAGDIANTNFFSVSNFKKEIFRIIRPLKYLMML